MNYEKLEYYLSAQRLNRYLTAAGHSKDKAEELYRINLMLSQAFYPILNMFEVSFRNSINNQLTDFFDDPHWIVAQKNGFMNDKSLSPRYWIKGEIEKAEKKLRNPEGHPSSGKIIAEQTFGFWISLYLPHHFKLLRGSIINVFPNKPSYISRKDIWKVLEKIRKFRNRVYHNEPICFSGRSVYFGYSEKIRTEIYNVLSWMDNDLNSYVNTFDGINEILNLGSQYIDSVHR